MNPYPFEDGVKIQVYNVFYLEEYTVILRCLEAITNGD